MNLNVPALRRLAPLCCALLAACPRPSPGPADPLEEASRTAERGRADARELALAGFAASLQRSQPDEALALWKRALEKQEDAWALYGLADAARRSLDTRTRATSALRLCSLVPRDPLCAVGARIVYGAIGESPRLDAELEQGAAKALAAGADGDAAYLLRLAIAAARRNQGDESGARAAYADAGVIDRALLLGPYSRYHYLEWDRAFGPQNGDLGGEGPLGPIVAREAVAPDGHYALWSEPTAADVYYWVSDVVVPSDALYQARVAGKGAFALWLDGNLALERRDFEAFLPEAMVVDVALPAGRHRLALKVARGTERGDVWVALSRADGQPAGLAASAAHDGPEAAPLAFSTPLNAWSGAAQLAAALEPQAGRLLAAYVAARDTLGRDDQGARALAEELAAQQPSAALLALRGEAMLNDPSLPERTAAGRARRDFERALELDPREAAVLQRLTVEARNEGRLDEASELLERARAAAPPGSWRVLLTEVRLAQARGVDALAADAAGRALALEPGLCDALATLYDLARRNEAAAGADRLAEEQKSCPDGLRRRAEHLRTRGELAAARADFQRLAEQSPLLPGPHQDDAALALALGKPGEAAAIWAELSRSWPLHAGYHKRRADALERAGDAAGARAARELALKLDGSDLKLRRALAHADGREVLQDLAQDGRVWLERYRAASPAENAPGVFVLDSSAIEVHPDGSFTERTHALAKVVDQRGVSMLAEVHVPAGAEVLELRTIKKDGRVLEPEEIGGKEGISLPGVEVGDFVEWEYLASQAARGPAMPGFAAPKFYFRIADGQLFHSTYEVRAPEGTGLVADAHGMNAPAPSVAGGWEVLKFEADQVPMFVREPNGPSTDEVIPFVQAGAGAGDAEMMAGFGDFLLDRARPNAEVERFARQATQGLSGRAAVEALWQAVMTQIKGAEAALTTRATSTLAEGRGSRLMLLRACLRILGIPSRVVLVRPFHADPAPYRFPAAELWGEVALQVTLPDGELMLQPAVRWAPFGELGPQARGRPAAVLPEPGEQPRFLRTPTNAEREGKRVSLALQLDADGTLRGSGEEVYEGFNGAWLKASLERLSVERRRQAVEASIARTFEGASLVELKIDEEERAGAPVAVRYRFVAPGFARREGGRLVVARGLYPADLGRRFLALSERQTPLLVASPERVDLQVLLSVPAGFALAGEPQSTRLESPFGSYQRVERPTADGLALEESLRIEMSRVPPEQYRAFGDFLVAIDRAQGREWLFQEAAVPPR